MDDFIDAWHSRVHGALADGLQWLARNDSNPSSDGNLGAFVGVLRAMRFRSEDAPHIVALIEKLDPYLQEAGVELATSLLRDTEDWSAVEQPIARMIARGPVDSWVALALVKLLGSTSRSYGTQPVAIYRELAKQHRKVARGVQGICRNRAIRPWDDLEDLYAQHIIQELEPGERESAVLAVLERKLGTNGFRATQDRILSDLGFDPEEHRKLLRQRP